MNVLRTCTCALAAVLLAGCAAASAQSHAAKAPATGHVTGRLLMEGGAISLDDPQPGERPIPGTVTFTAGYQQVAVQVGSSGRITAWLPPGTYQVTGRSPYIETVSGSGTPQELPCAQLTSATVTAGHTTTITLTCIVP